MSRTPFIALLAKEPLINGTDDVITSIPLDVRQSSSYEFSSKATENPVESGAVITDHVIKDPVRISLSGLVGEGSVTQVSTKGSDDRPAPGKRCIKAYQALKSAWENATLLTVITELGIFDDMVIVSLSIPRSAEESGNALWFTIEMVSLIIVDTLTASLPPDVIAKIKRRRKKSKDKLTTRQSDLVDKIEKENSLGSVSKQAATADQSTSATSNASSSQLAFTGGRL